MIEEKIIFLQIEEIPLVEKVAVGTIEIIVGIGIEIEIVVEEIVNEIKIEVQKLIILVKIHYYHLLDLLPPLLHLWPQIQ
jgi:hypothetical protein